MASGYGDDIEQDGSLAAAVHRGLMTVKDGPSPAPMPKGVLDAAEQGEDHAVSEFEKALEQQRRSPADLRALIEIASSPMRQECAR